MAAVYSLLREPSLALLGTHTYTFYFQHFPSGYLIPIEDLAAREATASRVSWSVSGFAARVRVELSPRGRRSFSCNLPPPVLGQSSRVWWARRGGRSTR